MNKSNTDLAEQIRDAVAGALLAGEAYQCTRVWEAWMYKTMTDEDFVDASDGPLPEEIAAAVLPIVAEAVKRGQVEAWDDCAHEADRRWLIGAHSAALLHDANPYREGDTR